MESQYFYPFKYHLGLCVKKIIFILKKSKYRRTVLMYRLYSGSEKASFSESQRPVSRKSR